MITPRIVDLHARYQVEIDLRIVHPAAIRNPSYFARMDPLARPYFMKDSARAAAFQGMPFRRPVPDPIEQDPVTLAIGTAQPLARRLSRLGIAAVARGRGLAFASEVGNLLWDGKTDDWNKDPHLADAAARAGLNLSELEADIADPDPQEAQLAANDSALRAAGHWGVPSMVFENEVFFGQDRFDVLMWRLKQRGLALRAP